MIQLPAGLAAWATELARLPVDLALAVAPWLGRLAVAVGPWPVSAAGGAGEPDGVGGLSRRGSYERLLASEWALADDVPDEFVRRAAAGEHLFLDVARRRPRAARWCIVIVSAGPGQLGAPRLAHVALLVVLARRAAAAGGELSWGVLEDAHLRIREGLDGDGVRRLLDARTTADGAAGVAAWTEALASDDTVERWWIGDAVDLDGPRRAGEPCVLVHDVIEPDVRALDLSLHRRGRRATVRLALPAPDLCARLLRDPTPPGPSPTVPVTRHRRLAAPARAIHVDASGRRLLVTHGGVVESWAVPNSPRDSIGPPRRWTVPAGHRLLAVGAASRTVLAAVAPDDAPDEVALVHASRPGSIRVELPDDVALALRAADEPPPLGACGLVELRRSDRRLVLVLAGRVLAISLRGDRARAEVLDAGPVLGIGLRPHRVEWAVAGGAGVVRFHRRGPSGVDEQDLRGSGAEPRAVFFGFDSEGADVAGDGGPAPFGPWAVAWSDGGCTIAAHRDHGPTFARAVDAAVVGVARWASGRPRLLVQAGGRELRWQGLALEPMRDTQDIVEVVVPCAQRYLAWRTDRGEVVVYSHRHDAVVLRLVPGEDADERAAADAAEDSR